MITGEMGGYKTATHGDGNVCIPEDGPGNVSLLAWQHTRPT